MTEIGGPHLSELLSRIAALEADTRRSRRLTLAVLPIVIGMAAIATSAAQVRDPSPGYLAVSELVLKDASGRVRARLSAPRELHSAEGDAGTGSSRATDDYAVRLTLLDVKGKARIEAGLAADGSPAIHLNDEGGSKGLELEYTSGPAVNLYSPDLHVIALSASRRSEGGLAIRGPGLGSEAVLAATGVGARLVIYERSRPRVLAGASTGLRDIEARRGASLQLWDSEGHRIFAVPSGEGK
jgi:hypothetical protein